MPGRSTKNQILNHTRGNVFRKGLDYAVILKRDVKALYLAATTEIYNIKTNQERTRVIILYRCLYLFSTAVAMKRDEKVFSLFMFLCINLNYKPHLHQNNISFYRILKTQTATTRIQNKMGLVI